MSTQISIRCALRRQIVTRRALTILIVLGIGSSAGLVTLAQAQEQAQDDAARSVHVHYNDLDLSTAVGAHTLYARIRFAAQSVCGYDDIHNLVRHAGYIQCYQQAVDNAVNSIHSTRLTQLNAGQHK